MVLRGRIVVPSLPVVPGAPLQRLFLPSRFGDGPLSLAGRRAPPPCATWRVARRVVALCPPRFCPAALGQPEAQESYRTGVAPSHSGTSLRAAQPVEKAETRVLSCPLLRAVALASLPEGWPAWANPLDVGERRSRGLRADVAVTATKGLWRADLLSPVQRKLSEKSGEILPSQGLNPSDDLLSIRRGTSGSNRETKAKTLSIRYRASTVSYGVTVPVEVCRGLPV